MSNTPKILAFAGSTRRASFNHQLVEIAARGAEAAGANVTVIRLSEYTMPLYDGDWEEHNGVPEQAKALKSLMFDHQGMLIACPEYNSSITGVLKNTIDWVSRMEDGEKPLQAFNSKLVSLMSTSPGALGGLRGLVHVRSILGNVGCIVLPDQVAVPLATKAFDSEGVLTDEAMRGRVEALGANVAQMLSKLRA